MATSNIPLEKKVDMYEGKRTQKYGKNDKETVCFYDVTYAF